MLSTQQALKQATRYENKANPNSNRLNQLTDSIHCYRSVSLYTTFLITSNINFFFLHIHLDRIYRHINPQAYSLDCRHLLQEWTKQILAQIRPFSNQT